jgi:hypothetical protein
VEYYSAIKKKNYALCRKNRDRSGNHQVNEIN